MFLVVLERLDGNVEFLDSVDTPEVWTTEPLETAIIGITGAHAHWLGREAELLGADSWVGRDDETPGMLPLWRAMYDQYRIDFPQWVDDATYDRATAVIDATPTWWAELVAMPRTLVHNDFNPRNIALRKGSGLVAYDWELATVQVPQRDLVDLLAHVLGPDASPESVDHFVEFQRRALESASGITLDADVWRRGYSSASPTSVSTACRPLRSASAGCHCPGSTISCRPPSGSRTSNATVFARGRPMRLKSIAALAMSRRRLVLVAALLFLIVSGAVGADAIESCPVAGSTTPDRNPCMPTANCVTPWYRGADVGAAGVRGRTDRFTRGRCSRT